MDGSKTNIYVGIDIAKRAFDVAFLPEGPTRTLPNDHEGFQQLLDRIRRPECPVSYMFVMAFDLQRRAGCPALARSG